MSASFVNWTLDEAFYHQRKSFLDHVFAESLKVNIPKQYSC